MVLLCWARATRPRTPRTRAAPLAYRSADGRLRWRSWVVHVYASLKHMNCAGTDWGRIGPQAIQQRAGKRETVSSSMSAAENNVFEDAQLSFRAHLCREYTRCCRLGPARVAAHPPHYPATCMSGEQPCELVRTRPMLKMCSPLRMAPLNEEEPSARVDTYEQGGNARQKGGGHTL